VSCIIAVVKRRIIPVSAILLATLGSFLILVVTVFVMYLTLFLGALGNLGKPPCSHCINVGPLTNATATVGGVGILLAAVTFWTVFRSVRSPRNQR
jgi:hypothetical protein